MRSGASWDKVSSAYGALITGAIGGYGPDHRDHRAGRAADLRRARRRARLPRRPVQHRRPGPGDLGRDPRRVRRLHLAPAAGASTCSSRSSRGLIGGGIWGGIVGWLKARTGAHEVIVTIMMNYIAAGLLAYLLTTDGVPAARSDRPDLADRRLERDLPPARGQPAAPRLRARADRGRRRSGGCSTGRPPASRSARSAPTRTRRPRPG